MTDYLDSRFDLDDADLVSVYDELSLWSAAFGLQLLEHVPLRGDTTALDVGCGTGFPLLELAQRLGSTSRVIGVDPWWRALGRGHEKVRYLRLNRVHLVNGDAAHMPFAERCFDLIVSNLGVNNFADPRRVMAECGRVARDKAAFVLTSNLQGHMKELYDVFERVLRHQQRTTELEALAKHVAHRTTVDGLVELLAQGGFTVRDVHRSEFPMRFANGSAVLHHRFVQLGFLRAWLDIVGGDRDFFVSLEQALNAEADASGGLSLTIPAVCVVATRS